MVLLPGGKTLKMRLDRLHGIRRVQGARTRCPVSAAVSAVAMVSRSRHLAHPMTSGSWRRTWMRACPKLGVSV